MADTSIQKQPTQKRTLILIGAGIPILYQILLTLFGSFFPNAALLPPALWLSFHFLTGILFIICPLLAAYLSGLTFGEAWLAIGGRGVNLREGSFVILLGLLAILPVQWLGNVIIYLLFKVSSDFGFPQSAQDIIPFILLTLVVAPLGEEVFFRGYFGNLGWKPWVFIIVSSILWSVAHVDPLAFIPLVWAGIVLAYIRQRQQSIFSTLVLHICINALALLQYFLTK